ncbi:MAG: hypothetical protein QM530_10580, partial [Phycisphaerales bacterium]|nr:hypothetical protein [Phycisphaerales bacterium]
SVMLTKSGKARVSSQQVCIFSPPLAVRKFEPQTDHKFGNENSLCLIDVAVCSLEECEQVLNQ